MEVQVQGYKTSLSVNEVANSPVLSELCDIYGSQTVIDLDLPLHHWLIYRQIIKRLDDEAAAIAAATTEESLVDMIIKPQYDLQADYADQDATAIFVMDFLDNRQQLKLWYEVTTYYYQLDLQTTKTMLQSTSFLLADIDTFFTTTSISQMANYVKQMASLPSNYIQHIILSLFDQATYQHYQRIIQHTSYQAVNNSRVLFGNNDPFIVTHGLGRNPTRQANYNSLPIGRFVHFHQAQNNIIISSSQPVLISPRIANYYKDRRIYKLNELLHSSSGNATSKPHRYPTDMLCACLDPNDRLRSQLSIHGKQSYSCGRDTDILLVSHDNRHSWLPALTTDQISSISKIASANDEDDDSYQPFSAHATDMSYFGFHLRSYNLATKIANGDFYLFLICEIDPFAKILYGFCL